MVFHRRSSFFNYHSDSFECTTEPITRNPDRFQQYLDIGWNPYREKYRNENLSINKADIVIVGDSLVHMYHYPDNSVFNKQFPNTNIVGRGIGGDTTGLLLSRIYENVLVLKPQTIIIEIGGNDLIFGICLSTIEDNIRKIIQIIQEKSPGTRIIFLSIPPVENSTLNSISPVYNLFLRTLTEEYSNIYYIELWKYMRQNDSPRLKPEYGFGDKIHLNQQAYQLWGEILRPYITKK
jgi:lysophospholipase L1-like esterase